jgi:hypothetical protein
MASDPGAPSIASGEDTVTARNWGRARDRARMRAKGVEAAAGDDLPFTMPLLRRRRRGLTRRPPTKAEQRLELERMVAEYIKVRKGDA